MSTKDQEISNSLPGSSLNRLVRGVASNGLSQILAAANAILLVPLFISAWGTDGYGRWLSLTALISYLALLDLGGQAYIGNLIASAYARNDETGFRRVLTEGVSLFLMIALIAFVILLILLFWPGLSLPGEGVPLNLNERLIILFMALHVLIGVPGGVYVTLYRSTGRFFRGQMAGNVVRGMALLVFVSLLLQKAPPILYAVAVLGQGLVMTAFIIFDTRREIPTSRSLKIGLQYARAGAQHLTGSLAFWLLALAGALNLQGVILVLNAGATSTDVALYATHRTAVGTIGYVGALVLAPLWPELTFLDVRKRQDELTRVCMLSVKIIVWISALAACGLWLVLPFLYPLWTDNQLDVVLSLLTLLLIQAVLVAGWRTSSWVLLASNQHRRLMWWELGNAGFTVIVAWLLVPKWGVVGVASATLMGDVLFGFLIYPRIAAHHLQIAVRRIYLPIASSVVLVLVMSISIQALCPLVPILALFAITGIALIGITAIASRLLLDRDEYNWLMGAARKIPRGAGSAPTDASI